MSSAELSRFQTSGRGAIQRFVALGAVLGAVACSDTTEATLTPAEQLLELGSFVHAEATLYKVLLAGQPQQVFSNTYPDELADGLQAWFQANHPTCATTTTDATTVQISLQGCELDPGLGMVEGELSVQFDWHSWGSVMMVRSEGAITLAGHEVTVRHVTGPWTSSSESFVSDSSGVSKNGVAINLSGAPRTEHCTSVSSCYADGAALVFGELPCIELLMRETDPEVGALGLSSVNVSYSKCPGECPSGGISGVDEDGLYVRPVLLNGTDKVGPMLDVHVDCD